MEVHQSVLKLTESWQKAIAAEFAHQDLAGSTAGRQLIVQVTMVVLGLYLGECRGLLKQGRLQAVREADQPLEELRRLWQILQGWGVSFFSFAPRPIPLSHRLLQEMIDSLCGANPTRYTELSVEILAQVYESTLAQFDAAHFDTAQFDAAHFDTAQFEAPASQSSVFPLRKSGGVYYTPKPIVEYMVQTTIDNIINANLHTVISDDINGNANEIATLPYLPRILDPACGGGAFLIAAYQNLIDRQRNWQLERAPQRLQWDRAGQPRLRFADCRRLLGAVYGVDVDADAIAVTRLSLALKLLENLAIPEEIYSQELDLHSTIQCGNALVEIAANGEEHVNLGSTSINPNPPKLTGREDAFPNWQDAFPQVFAAGGFDGVIGNPPYIDAETMTAHLPHWRSYCAAHYQAATGNWDLFCVFIEKALQLCRPGGITSLIVPNKLLSAHYARAARSILTHGSQVLAIRDYAQVSVFDASVYPIVYVAQKVSPLITSTAAAAYPTQYEQMQTIDRVGQSYPLSLFAFSPQPWLIGISVQTDLMQRLDRLPKLGAVVQVTGAATVAEAYLLKALIQSNPIPDTADLRVVNSGTIDRYCFLWGDKPLRYLGQSYRHPVISQGVCDQLPPKRLRQAQQPKIIVAGLSQRLECGLDPSGGFLAGKSTVVIQAQSDSAQPSPAQPNPLDFRPECSIDLRYWLGLLNSRLLSFYLLSRFGGNRLQGGYIRIGPPQLRDLPVVMPSPAQAQVWASYHQLIEQVERLQKLAACPTQSHRQFHQQSLTATESPDQPHHPEQTELQLDRPHHLQMLDAAVDAIVYELYQLSDQEVRAVREWGG